MKKSLATAARSFYGGYLYPAVNAAIVLIGHVTGLEYYFNILNVLLFTASLFLCESFRHGIIFLVTFSYQVTPQHSPGVPSFTDYYFVGWRLVIVILLVLIFAAGMLFRLIKNRTFRRINFRDTPALLPLLMLCAAFLLNGVFSRSFVWQSALLGFLEAGTYFSLFILFFHGITDGDMRDMRRYLPYVTSLIAWVILLEMLNLYLTSDDIITDGSINKVGMILGWGIWTTVGVCLAVLIPMLFYGAAESGRTSETVYYFVTATLTAFGCLMTMSRNALLFGALTYGASFIAVCVAGKRKKLFRILLAAGVVILAAGCAVFWKKIYELFSDYFKYGISDNGRFDIWRYCMERFRESPIFGAGFFGLDPDPPLYPFPRFAHNTAVQMLGACGIAGAVAYTFYRVTSFIPFFRKPNLFKTMLFMSVMSLLLSSLLDIFMFSIQPIVYYTVCLAIAWRDYGGGAKFSVNPLAVNGTAPEAEQPV